MSTLANIAQYTAANAPRLARICFFLENDWNNTPIEGSTAQTITSHLDVSYTKVFELFFVRASEDYAEEATPTPHGFNYETSVSIRIPKDRATVADVLEAINTNKLAVVYKDRNDTYKLLRQLTTTSSHQIGNNNAIELSLKGTRSERNLFIKDIVFEILTARLPKAHFTLATAHNFSSATITGIEYSQLDGVLSSETDYSASSFEASATTCIWGDITFLYLFSGGMETLDVSELTALRELRVYGNDLETLDLTNNTALQKCVVYSNNLDVLNLTGLANLTQVTAQYNNISTLDISTAVLLTTLRCDNNNLSSLNISNNTLLTSLICWNNNLTALTLTPHTALTNLVCNENSLTALNISTNTLLTQLAAHTNLLTALDISNNTLLTTLEVQSNSLSGSELNGILSDLVAHGLSNGILNIASNSGTHTDTTSYNTLISRGWTITA